MYALTTHQLQVERRERGHSDNQVYALTTHQLQVERRESHRDNQVYALTTHQLQMETRESHRANQVYVLTHTPATGGGGERVIEPIKCMCSPHTSYRWRGERVIEPIKCMLSPHTSYRWRGEQWWSVTKYNYFVTVLKYIFQVSVLYWSSFILSNFYFYFTTFQSIRSYFLLHYIS